MCDPVTIIGGAVAGLAANKLMKPKTPSYGNPEAERMQAEADASASANAKLVASQKRRRQQQNLLAQGAQPSVGDVATNDSPLSAGKFFSSWSQRGGPDVLMGRGAAGGDPVTTPGGGRKRLTPPARGY